MECALNNAMCRCCASEGTFKDIKTKYHWMGEEEVYADMLTECFDIKILTTEDADNGICEVCITQLRNAANFKKQVLHTEEQFKKRLDSKAFKNPIKLESADDPADSDHLSDVDAEFSGTEYDVSIKEEAEEKPKARKRAAKPTTSRAKKTKTETKKELAVRRIRVKLMPAPERTTKIAKTTYQYLTERTDENKMKTVATQVKMVAKKVKTGTTKVKKGATKVKRKSQSELSLRSENLRTILSCSNATPIRRFGSVGYMCHFCPVEFPKPTDLKKHTADQHIDVETPEKYVHNRCTAVKLDITSLKCKECSLEYDEIEDLLKHLKFDHDELVHLDVKNHIVPFKFETEKLQCALCPQQHFHFPTLLDHMRRHCRFYVCDICDEGYLTGNSLRMHRRQHEAGEHRCTDCDKVYATVIKLRNHIQTVHEGFKRNKCGYCGERFAYITGKLDHLQSVHGIKKPDFRCLLCDRTFNRVKNLNEHCKRLHLLEKTHECTECGMKFFDKNGLREHMVKHTGIREFECGVCGKAFGYKNALREHIKIHTDDRRFRCELCDSAFLQKCSWRAHMRNKHGEIV